MYSGGFGVCPTTKQSAAGNIPEKTDATDVAYTARFDLPRVQRDRAASGDDAPVIGL